MPQKYKKILDNLRDTTILPMTHRAVTPEGSEMHLGVRV